MPRRTHKRRIKRQKTRKQKPIVMIGCSKKKKKACSKKAFFSTLSNNHCPNCGPNCHCGPNCKCPHSCSGNCYLNRVIKKQKGGVSGCGSCGCPISPLSWNKMNKFGGQPVIISPPQKDYVPILGIGQNGGNCSSCGQIPQSGGNFYKQSGPIPGPIVGKPWGGDLKWPAMNDVGGDRNYLNPYNTNNNPQQQMSMNNAGYLTKNSMIGGYRYKKTPSLSSLSGLSSNSKSKKGGGLVPQDLVNLGRDFHFNFKSAYNALNGYKAPVNPAPYKDQLSSSLNKSIFV